MVVMFVRPSCAAIYQRQRRYFPPRSIEFQISQLLGNPFHQAFHRDTAAPYERFRGTLPLGYRDVIVKGFVDEVVILCGTQEIARHKRSYGRAEFVCDPRHYLALIEQKPGALDQAAALQGWPLSPAFADLRRMLETRMGNRGKREFVQVLRLMETFPEAIVAAAVGDAIRLGAPGFDAVKQLVIARIEHRPPRLDTSAYPYLPKPTVATTRAADYAALLSETAA